MRFYSTFDEFIDDMNTLFNNFVKFRGECMIVQYNNFSA